MSNDHEMTRANKRARRVEASREKAKPAGEFDGWTPDMLCAAVAFERVTVAELRLQLHRAREENAALARDARIGAAVRDVVDARNRRISDPIAYLEGAAHPHTLSGEILLAVARVLRKEASDV